MFACDLLFNSRFHFRHSLPAVKFIFFFLNFLVYFNFTLVAGRWQKYVRHWESAERQFQDMRVMQHQSKQLQKRITRIAVVVMFFAFSEFSS